MSARNLQCVAPTYTRQRSDGMFIAGFVGVGEAELHHQQRYQVRHL